MSDKKSSWTLGLSGSYAKAKQRVLNSVGKRTTITRNPRVDYISKKVDYIRNQKAKAADLAKRLSSHVTSAQKLAMELDELFLEVYHAELGTREWDTETKEYKRVLDPEELKNYEEIQTAFKAYHEDAAQIIAGFTKHLIEVKEKPLTFNTPEEKMQVAKIEEVKAVYKTARTAYSDCMIDYDIEVQSKGTPSEKIEEKLEAAKLEYEKQSEEVTNEALKFEKLYRDELTQRIQSHFTAQSQLLRGLHSRYKEMHPYAKGISLDWVELKQRRKLEREGKKKVAHKDDDSSDDDRLEDHVKQTLPLPKSSSVKSNNSFNEPTHIEQGSFKQGLYEYDSSVGDTKADMNPFDTMSNKNTETKNPFQEISMTDQPMFNEVPLGGSLGQSSQSKNQNPFDQDLPSDPIKGAAISFDFTDFMGSSEPKKEPDEDDLEFFGKKNDRFIDFP